MKYLIKCILCASLLLGSLYGCISVGRVEHNRIEVQDGRYNTKCDPCYISFVRLLANPEKYDGRKVAIVGYLVAKPEQWPTLYLSEQSANDRVGVESVVLLDGEDSPVIKKARQVAPQQGLPAVYVIGVFDARYAGDTPFRFGSLKHVILQELRDLPKPD